MPDFAVLCEKWSKVHLTQSREPWPDDWGCVTPSLKPCNHHGVMNKRVADTADASQEGEKFSDPEKSLKCSS